ncbi:hypothetical protein WAI453_009236 [Rhynchosporium graminicola]
MKLTSTVILFILAPMLERLGLQLPSRNGEVNTRWAYTPQVYAVHKGEHIYMLYVLVAVYRRPSTISI